MLRTGILFQSVFCPFNSQLFVCICLEENLRMECLSFRKRRDSLHSHRQQLEHVEKLIPELKANRAVVNARINSEFILCEARINSLTDDFGAAENKVARQLANWRR